MGKILFNRSERSCERSTNNVSFVIGSFSITQSLSRKPTMAKYTTLKDVAKLAGVSYQTVSKVLRGQIQVSPETKTRIEAAVQQLGYRPNISARSLRMQESRLIGYSWHPSYNNSANPVLEQFLQSIIRTAEHYDYHILLFPFHLGNDILSVYQDLIITNRVDGFILSDLDYDDQRIPLLLEYDFPFVAFGRSNPEYNFPYVDVDGRAGILEATRHLLEQGHRKIAMLAWPPRSRSGKARLNGYQQAMQEVGIQIEAEWILRGEGTYQFGYNATTQLLHLPPAKRPTAIVNVMDEIAVGALRAVQAHNLTPGRDIAITGFDDSPATRYLKPGLTSLRQPVEKVGKQVVTMLIKLQHKEELEEKHVLFKPELIIRESSLGFKSNSTQKETT